MVWNVLATWWRKDGTPVPDRKFFNSLANGDPLAIAYLGTIVAIFVASSLYKAHRKR
jgi:hypothetical protein